MASRPVKFKEFHAGKVIKAGPVLVDEAAIVDFGRRYDPQPFHVDRDVAGQTRWKGLIASGFHTAAIAMGLVVQNILCDSESMGSPGLEHLRWPHPVRPGDQLRLRVEIREVTRSSSGRVGIVRWQWWLTNQQDAIVLDLVATSLFDLRADAPAAADR